jgi:gamma-glutamyltranspeptidase/glutathione hydrolase
MVGTALCVGVVGMYHAGLGGGGFMLVRAPNGSYEHIDFRETAPAAARLDMFDREPRRSVVGGLAAGVPGEVRGLATLHKRYGKLPWSDVVMPSARLARDGWQVNRDLVRYMGFVVQRDSFLTSDPNWALDFAPQGKLLAFGDHITRKRYAATLETIANSGPEAFYSGPIADATIAELKKQGGNMTAEDLKDYKVIIRKPIEINYRGYRLVSCGTPASGSVVLAAMAIVEGYGDFGWPEALNISTHRLDEAIRFAYGLVSRMHFTLYNIADRIALR